MRMLKKCFALLLVVVVFTVIPANATNLNTEESVQPRYIGVSSVRANLDISSSGRASVGGTIRTYSGYTVTVSVSLMQDGTSIKSWSKSGSGILTISQNYYVMSGHDYYTSLYISVYNSNNQLVDTITTSSNTVSY